MLSYTIASCSVIDGLSFKSVLISGMYGASNFKSTSAYQSMSAKNACFLISNESSGPEPILCSGSLSSNYVKSVKKLRHLPLG
jgi:hypothetical protein